jgi:hypothetical protein
VAAEETVLTALSGYANLVALVGQRIYPDAMPEKTLYPAVVFSRPATEPIRTIHGTVVTDAFVDISITAWGRTRTQADGVANRVIEAIQAAGETWTGRSGAYDAEMDLYASTVEVSLLSI